MSAKKGLDLSGLDNFSALMGGDQAPTQSAASTDVPEGFAGNLIRVPLKKIHKDADNARKTIDPQELRELADSMKSVNPATGKPRGNKNPVSLKPHPDIPGEYILNAGERRCAAAELAELPDVLAFIDEDADEFDNAVDNIQRVALSPIETATFIQRRIEKGDKKSAIAARLGKPASFVSDHIIFFDMADCIRDMYDSGRVVSMQAMALLHRAYKKYTEEVEAFCAEAQDELTTADVRAFCDSLKEPESKAVNTSGDNEEGQELPSDANAWIGGSADSGELEKGEEQQPLVIDGEPISGGPFSDLEDEASKIIAADEASDKIKKAIVQIQYDERPARLLTNRRASYGFGWIKYDDDGSEDEVDLKVVSVVAIVEG
ncbi:ParB/RepB/Spo0J family partition protein [Salmonella enterica]|uniref:ParB/RepB/Spo0J family partition protein n=1 Tax=Salmonella enterica TaxID=28901 RepID=UPI000D585287|nr:ParB/RepB/Spo0J family partition protein [Salmonella enterica]EBV8266704.1 ParB/RepB/Spo0J family partition protein [Salmonella enterica subsp. enterica serovar Rubislaw]EDU6175421.1 ParB/RepB/Spo0J family partition protein [Salmonella enterica subsp. enterica serovar Javiana]EEM3642807.1 ParB/RepB/Spo0J family partition protein [Salmonella enterica subsp. enterica serovar Typhimurium]EAU0231766.1 ParB/RepB/Spo0J family partition protein [Salmonella enterica]EAX3185375.1 ParB/RepB/Spo0J fam